MPSFYIPLSGLDADSTALNTIANNLSNMNTTGFKAQTTNFTDLFYQELGSNGAGDEIQQGSGVQVASNSTDFSVGSIASTNVASNAAINGNGFFVLDNGGGSQLYTRNGSFQLSSSGTLETTGGLAVMGYPAVNGVVNVAGGLTDVTIPTGQVMAPAATTTFSMTQNLDSEDAIGTEVSGQVQIYDSLGKSYEATVTYTKTGTNQWSYNITTPDTLAAAPAVPAAATTMAVAPPKPTPTIVAAATTPVEPAITVVNPVSVAAPAAVSTSSGVDAAAATVPSVTTNTLAANTAVVGTIGYTFAPTGTVGGNTALKITDGVKTATVALTAPDEDLVQFAKDINNALTAAGVNATATGTDGVPATNTDGTLNIVDNTGAAISVVATPAGVQQDVAETTSNYNLVQSNNGQYATVDPGTTLAIQLGNGAAVSVPAAAFQVNGVNSSIDLATYAAALQTAVGQPAVSGITVSANATGQLSIKGPANMTVTGNIDQDFTGVTQSFTFGSYTDPATGAATQATVDSSTSLTISAPNSAGQLPLNPIAITLSNPAGESVAAFAQDINTQLAAADITCVTAKATNGVLTLSGPANMTIGGYVNQDILGTTVASSVSPSTPTVATTSPLLAAAAPVAAAPSVTGLTANAPVVNGLSTTDSYTFAPTGLVDSGTSLTVTVAGTPYAVALTHLVNGTETVAQLASDINAVIPPASGVVATGTNGVTATAADGSLSIAGATGGFSISGSMKQSVALNTTDYNFVTSNGSLATVGTGTTLAISEGAVGPISAPASTTSQSISSYATAFQSALTANGITDVQVEDNNGVLAITAPADATISGKVQQQFTGAQTTFDFGAYTDPNTGLSVGATVAPATSLTITGPTTMGGTANVTIQPSNPAGESVAQYAADVQTALNKANITGVTVTQSNGVLSIVGPDTVTVAGSVAQDMLGTTENYAFEANSTVDPATNLVISGQTASGATATITAPAVASGETLAQYATALTSALSTAQIANVTVTASNGQLSIVGANVSTTGSVKQGLADTAIDYNFGPTATVNPATNITIVGPTVSGVPPTAITTAPTVTAGETVAQYAAALNNALMQAGIDTSADGVSVTATGGQLSIVGPAATLKTAGSASQDLTATTITYNLGVSGGQVATVDPSTNLTITGQTTSGGTATTTAPTIAAGETLASYSIALTNALATAGIAGVTVSATAAGQLSITGANISTSGSLIQDAVASANASGTLTFNSAGNLVNPAANLNGITFAGLSDGANQLNLDWQLFGANGSGNISQTASASTTSATSQNGYTSGQYQSFAIDSSGVVTATFSNSQTQTVGQLAIATVTNEQGLQADGSSNYQTTESSGDATVGVAGAGGRGTIEGSSLEASNVNISAEFSDLIVAQRAYEANAKAVTTFDTVTQETINLIH